MKYADLSSARDKDYGFAWDRMLAMEGNTSVYLQYANARIRSILRRADAAGARAGSTITVGEPAERALAIALLARGTRPCRAAWHHLDDVGEAPLTAQPVDDLGGTGRLVDDPAGHDDGQRGLGVRRQPLQAAVGRGRGERPEVGLEHLGQLVDGSIPDAAGAGDRHAAFHVLLGVEVRGFVGPTR